MFVSLALVVPVALADHAWGDEVWGDLAPAWPGGAYAFAATVGALVPLALAALMAPLSRMNWKRSKGCSVGWAVVGAPGFALGWVLTVVISGAFRPKHRRNWDSECHSRGHACWVHERYPWIWAVGVLATLVTAALLITVLVRLVRRADRASRPAGGNIP
ncbi:hypothetical protein ABZX30_13825 [Streptomyces sp. NPDC004542]|uniref:hypothetical protein n=1 Tax=Streptomyces sp. NPDC004542 TaxID=3154281 RepID=UPI00339E9504